MAVQRGRIGLLCGDRVTFAALLFPVVRPPCALLAAIPLRCWQIHPAAVGGIEAGVGVVSPLHRGAAIAVFTDIVLRHPDFFAVVQICGAGRGQQQTRGDTRFGSVALQCMHDPVLIMVGEEGREIAHRCRGGTLLQIRPQTLAFLADVAVAERAEIGATDGFWIENIDNDIAEVEIVRGVQPLAVVAVAAGDVQCGPGFADQQRLGVDGFDPLGEAGPVVQCGLGIRLLRQRAVFDRVAHGVETKAVDAFFQPECGKRVEVGDDLRIA